MAIKGYSQGVKLRLLGTGFILFLLGCLLVLIAIFNQTFVRSEPLFVEIGAAGSQMNNNADVKLRGINVGRVASQEVEDGRVLLELAIQPDRMEDIPENVQAAVVPKTLFGEKFVELRIPEGSLGAQPIAAEATIPENRTTEVLEAERAFSNTVPLLRAVEPAELNMVLEQMATALQGRGDALGDNFSRTERYLAGFEPSLPDFVENISLLATVADSYDRAAPDLLRFLRQQTITARTITEEQDVLADFLAGTDEFNATMNQVLEDNEERIVQLAAEGRPVLETLSADRRGFGKFFEKLAGFWDGGIETINNPVNNPKFGRSPNEPGPFLTISIEFSPGKGEQSAQGYFACPRYGPHFGTEPGAQNPSCVEGAPSAGGANPLDELLGQAPQLPGPPEVPGLPEPPDLGLPELPVGGLGGDPEEIDLLADLLGPSMDRSPEDVPDVAGMMAGSLSGERTPLLGQNRQSPAPRPGTRPSRENDVSSLLGGLLR